MPKDNWAKYRSRDIGKAALRSGKAIKSPISPSSQRRRARRNRQAAKPELFVTAAEWIGKLGRASSNEQLDSIGRDLVATRKYIRQDDFRMIVSAGMRRRASLASGLLLEQDAKTT